MHRSSNVTQLVFQAWKASCFQTTAAYDTALQYWAANCRRRLHKATLTSLPGSRVGALQVLECASPSPCVRARCDCGSGVRQHGRLQCIQCWRGGVWHLGSENISNPVFQVPKSTERPLLTTAARQRTAAEAGLASEDRKYTEAAAVSGVEIRLEKEIILKPERVKFERHNNTSLSVRRSSFPASLP